MPAAVSISRTRFVRKPVTSMPGSRPFGAEASVAILDLPGRLEAFSRAPIYARVSGYLKSWNADIGASVKAGQPLAEPREPLNRR